MAVLTVTSRKGGCGKTTLAMILAATMADEGTSIALLDADPNGSAHRWATSTYTGPHIAAHAEADAERLAELLPRLTDQHEVLVIDTAGFGNQAATVAAAGADAVLVPATPGEGDIVEAQRTVAFVDGLGRSTRRLIPVRVVINRLRRSTTLSRHVLTEIDNLKLPRLRTTLSEAVAFGEVGFSGTKPQEGTAASEVAELVAELRELGWLPATRQTEKAATRKAVNA